MSADLYLHELPEGMEFAYEQWRSGDPIAAVRAMLLSRGYDMDAVPSPVLPPHIQGLIGLEVSTANARRRGGEQLLRFAECPTVWIGQVSWLSAAAFDDRDRFVPTAVARVDELFLPLPVVDEELVAATAAALELPDTSVYGASGGRGVSAPGPVVEWLTERVGSRVYPVSH